MVFFLFIMFIVTLFLGVSNTYIWIFNNERFNGVFARSKIIYFKIAKYALILDVSIALTYLLRGVYYMYFKIH
jgi:hypothetical protein